MQQAPSFATIPMRPVLIGYFSEAVVVGTPEGVEAMAIMLRGS